MGAKRPRFRRRYWLLIGGLTILLALAAGALFVATGRAGSGRQRSAPAILARDLTLRGSDFAAGQAHGPLRKDAGLVLQSAATAVYTSPVIAAPLPFSDLGCLWEADLPSGASFLIEVRTSPDADGDRWSPWTTLLEEDDQPPLPYGQHGSTLLGVPQREGVHRRLQYRLHMAAVPAGGLPTLQRLTFTFIDARAGPTTTELMGRKGAAEPSAVGKPPIISREEWGCPEGEASPRWKPTYQRVSHIIVHHTATPNDDTDWAARVRAIWYYHANTRGWGDIGYNFLIDPRGNIYEGRAGGDDVIGGHAYNYNPGTMGVGNLGTYETAPVPQPLRQSLEKLSAWKCSERGIDPLGSSFNNYSVYPHIAGHRDVGQTSCPGAVLYSLLPAIRQAVQDILNQQEEQIVIDELSPAFTHSPAYWHDGCGLLDHGWWTHTTTDPNLSTNWAVWRPDLPQSGWYEVLAYVPSCSGGDWPEYTRSAHYRIYYYDGGTTVVVNQREEQGRWVSLGTYRFSAGTPGYVYLDDMADDHWMALWYDAVRWVLRAPWTAPPPLLQPKSPAADSWVESRAVTLSWSIPPTATLDGVRLVVATEPGLNTPLVDLRLGPVSGYALQLSADYPALFWTAQGYNRSGDGPAFAVRRFGVDTAPPVSAATGLYRNQGGTYILFWSGTDAGSGIASYTVQARDGTDGPWVDLWYDTDRTSGVVQVDPAVTRYFRVNARDALGHTELFHPGDGDLNSRQVTLLGHPWYFPLMLREAQTTPGPTATASPTPTPTFTAGPPPTPTVTLTPAITAPPTATPSGLPTPPPTATPTPAPFPTATRMPSPTRLPSPTLPGGLSSLPDLQVVGLRSSQGTPFDCGRPVGIAVEIANLGPSPAGPFDLELQGTGLQGCRWRLDGLQPGYYIERLCPQVVVGTPVTATVDPTGAVAEANEANNSLSIPMSVLILPTCTPRPNP